MSTSSASDTISTTNSEIDKLSTPNQSPQSNEITESTTTLKIYGAYDRADYEESRKCASLLSNGIHVDVMTPAMENNATEIVTSSSVASEEKKPKGRLKFFKDGLLCLELLHHDEGKLPKWIQTKAKTVYPPIVRVAKEAKIPCQSTPLTLFSVSTQLRSSNSTSVNDDGSSSEHSYTCTSPLRRLKEIGWRKIIEPRKGVSTEYTFYLKAAPCVRNFFKSHPSFHRKAHKYLHRRPYFLPDCTKSISSSNTNELKYPRSCDCDKLGVKENTKEDNILKKSSTDDPSLEQNKFKKSITQISDKLYLVRLNESQTQLVQQKQVEELKSIRTLNSFNDDQQKNTCQKKRVLKEEGNYKSKRRTAVFKSQQSKPILVVPGISREGIIHNKIEHKTDRAITSMNSPIPLPIAFSMVYGIDDTVDGMQNRVTEKNKPASIRSRTASTDKKKSLHGAKFLSSSKFTELANNYYCNQQGLDLKSAISKSRRFNKPKHSKSVEIGVSVKPEENQLLQQQTMSKAISYTINSLLGTGNTTNCSSTESTTNLSRKCIMDNQISSAEKGSSNRSDPIVRLEPNFDAPDNKTDCVPRSILQGNLFGVSIQDQNSFLRHLLDTSDPIPSTSCGLPSTAKESNSRSAKKRANKPEVKPPKCKRKISQAYTTDSTNLSGSKKSASKNTHLSNKQDHVIHAAHSRTSVSPKPPEGVHSVSSTRALTATFQRFNSSTGLPSSFIPNLSCPSYLNHRAGAHSTYETALNLCRREGGQEYLANHNIIDLSLSTIRNRAYNNSNDGWLPNGALAREFNGTESLKSLDNEVPLDLCKNSRPN